MCPELRVGIHVPYSINDWVNLPKLTDQYFSVGRDVMFEGRCRAQCNKTMHCKQFLSSAHMNHLGLLTLEGDNEMMFGGGNYGRPYKQGCAEHVERIYERYRTCLSAKCSL